MSDVASKTKTAYKQTLENNISYHACLKQVILIIYYICKFGQLVVQQLSRFLQHCILLGVGCLEKAIMASFP